VTLKLAQIPAIVVSALAIVKVFVGSADVLWIRIVQEVLSAGIIITITYLIVKILDQVVFYYLKQYAEQTEAQWDDVLIPILETIVPIVVYLIGGFLALQSVELDLTGLWVAFGGVTFVIGFAIQDILANFFSGVVLLIDTPFRFGDVIEWKKGTRAVIKKVGLRVTQLYLIDQHCELYVPNSKFQKQKLLNLSRPSPNYYYTVKVELGPDAETSRAIPFMEAVALAHPDTLGNIEEKLEYLDEYFGASMSEEQAYEKREAGRRRLLAEREVNQKLSEVENAFDSLSNIISGMEEGGLDTGEIRVIQEEYHKICQLIGLDVVADRGKRKRLEESQDVMKGSLIGLIRDWYGAWLKDPDLLLEDQKILPKEWEQKISLLKVKTDKLFRKIMEPSSDETRLDDAITELFMWIQEGFKTTRNEWQKPRIWVSVINLGRSEFSTKSFCIRFYVDDITLEHFQRGYRVESEITQELSWHLRKSYLVR
jgi:MscS family membrane protein